MSLPVRELNWSPHEDVVVVVVVVVVVILVLVVVLVMVMVIVMVMVMVVVVVVVVHTLVVTVYFTSHGYIQLHCSGCNLLIDLQIISTPATIRFIYQNHNGEKKISHSWSPFHIFHGYFPWQKQLSWSHLLVAQTKSGFLGCPAL